MASYMCVPVYLSRALLYIYIIKSVAKREEGNEFLKKYCLYKDRIARTPRRAGVILSLSLVVTNSAIPHIKTIRKCTSSSPLSPLTPSSQSL